jgi:hypothetical protein
MSNPFFDHPILNIVCQNTAMAADEIERFRRDIIGEAKTRLKRNPR